MFIKKIKESVNKLTRDHCSWGGGGWINSFCTQGTLCCVGFHYNHQQIFVLDLFWGKHSSDPKINILAVRFAVRFGLDNWLKKNYLTRSNLMPFNLGWCLDIQIIKFIYFIKIINFVINNRFDIIYNLKILYSNNKFCNQDKLFIP